MSECSWPTGAQYSGMVDGGRGKVSELGYHYLRRPAGDRGRRIYVFEYWASFIHRKGAEDVCFIYYPNVMEGTK